MQSAQAKHALIEAGGWLSEQGWVPATGGNFSIRTEQGFVVTASGHDKGALQPEHFLEFDIEGTQTAGTGNPSAETELHLALYALSPRTHCILHTHSVAATVLSRLTAHHSLDITGYEMQKALHGYTSHLETLAIPVFDNDQDIPALAGRVAEYHSHTPIQHGVLIRGHGLYAMGGDITETRRHIEALEFLFNCELTRRQLEKNG
ncbi:MULTISPECIES: methylthioribulose 1-phosphate dehydratase [unclassified Pseudoalteromonas]|uniref:methylthioribulose 1-phosphate dehydratase n=1 Tax=unclassified Pseudoalteromonas TaxID=194690 RepID=UPI002097A5B6|nr:methylthioribulose 1-phosphate dehydratase [Pseudoalteromonas sp. XMcav2-N]MCO7190086.1 methylthioribulose 1-phosphate dehydratase [Pseudoalteromonas sp. XMcav2-N]